LIAATVTVLALCGCYALFASSLRALERTKHHNRATQLASAALERVAATPFSELPPERVMIPSESVIGSRPWRVQLSRRLLVADSVQLQCHGEESIRVDHVDEGSGQVYVIPGAKSTELWVRYSYYLTEDEVVSLPRAGEATAKLRRAPISAIASCESAGRELTPKRVDLANGRVWFASNEVGAQVRVEYVAGDARAIVSGDLVRGVTGTVGKGTVKSLTVTAKWLDRGQWRVREFRTLRCML
jgi:hypothetical protein